MRPSSRSEDQQYAEGGARRNGEREKAIHLSSLAIEDSHAANEWQKKSLSPVRVFLRIFMLLNSACSVSGLLDWYGHTGASLHSIHPFVLRSRQHA